MFAFFILSVLGWFRWVIVTVGFLFGLFVYDFCVLADGGLLFVVAVLGLRVR